MTFEHGCAEPSALFPDWRRDFSRAADADLRLELEIGPGHGHFALDHAAADPAMDLVVIETRRADVELIRERAHKRGLRNLLAFHGDAKLLVPRFFPERSLSVVHVHFPDPWWKKRHQKRRMVDVELAALLRTLLRVGGEVDFRTDVPNYASEAVITWEEVGFVNTAGPGQLWTEVPLVLSTRERRYAQTGQPVFRARFTNPAEATTVRASHGRTGRDWTDVRRK
jgi:tRNA (guanine-N7-)-methyltransferase